MTFRAVVFNLTLPWQNIKSDPLHILEREKYFIKKGVVQFLLDGPRSWSQETVVNVALFARINAHKVASSLVFKHRFYQSLLCLRTQREVALQVLFLDPVQILGTADLFLQLVNYGRVAFDADRLWLTTDTFLLFFVFLLAHSNQVESIF